MTARQPRPTGTRSPVRPTAVSRDELHDTEFGLRTEWFEPDGSGGFAMGSVLGAPTRRQHGLLVVRPSGLERRHVLLAAMRQTLRDAQREEPLDSLMVDGRFERLGHLWLERFELEPVPTWTFRSGDLAVRRELLCVPGAVLLRWTLVGGPQRAQLELEPLVAMRDADRTCMQNDVLDPTVVVRAGRLSVRPYSGLPELHLSSSDPEIELSVAPGWTHGVSYAADDQRGYSDTDDLWCPGRLTATLERGLPFVLCASVDRVEPQPAARFVEAHERRVASSTVAPGVDPLAHRLREASDRFLYDAGDRRGVIAGFPWLAEWGRDTFLSLPGLTLAHGEVEACGDILEGAVDHLHEGLMPNHFGADALSDHYGAADTSLWFARAVRLYDRAGGSRQRIERVFLPAMREIGRAFVDGTELGLHVDVGGLLHVGSPTLTATWMDARVDDQPCTSRHGFPIEVQALWYSFIAYLERWFHEIGARRDAEVWSDLRRRAAPTFLERFVGDGSSLPVDVWRPDDADHSVRPNMVIAAALTHSPLSASTRGEIVRAAERELLTPRGLRTLATEDANYRGRCAGSAEARDHARHQGSAWPWLIGFLVEARLRAFPDDRTGLERLSTLVREVAHELERGCLGAIAEVFDGDPPHHAVETPAMAKSVAEIARALRLLEDGHP